MENGRRDLFGSCSRNDFHLPNRGAAFERTKLLCGEPCGQRLRGGLARLGGDASGHSHFETLAPLNLKETFMNDTSAPDLILENAKITTLDRAKPEATSLVVKNGRIVGVDDAGEYQRGPDTKVIDLQGRRVIPGLNDSHMHIIRGGLSYNLELRWDGVPSLADGLRMLKEQAQRTPPRHALPGAARSSKLQHAEPLIDARDQIPQRRPDRAAR